MRLGREPQPDDPMFPPYLARKPARRWHQSRLSKYLSAAIRFAGVKGTAHTLRRSHATIAKAAGADLDTIRRTLGHCDLSITARYFGEDRVAQRRSVAGLMSQVLEHGRQDGQLHAEPQRRG